MKQKGKSKSTKPAVNKPAVNKPAVNKPAVNKPSRTKPKKGNNTTKRAPNVALKLNSKSPQRNTLTPNNFEEAYRAMGLGMTRAQFKAQY